MPHAENQKALLEQLNEHIERVETESKIIRKDRHDFINILTSISIFLDEKNYDGLEKYFNDEVLSTEQRLRHGSEQIVKKPK